MKWSNNDEHLLPTLQWIQKEHCWWTIKLFRLKASTALLRQEWYFAKLIRVIHAMYRCRQIFVMHRQPRKRKVLVFNRSEMIYIIKIANHHKPVLQLSCYTKNKQKVMWFAINTIPKITSRRSINDSYVTQLLFHNKHKHHQTFFRYYPPL